MLVYLESVDGTAVAVSVEVARDPRTIEHGLAGRVSLDDDNGMLFMFDEEANHPMWMRGVSFPLDMIFIRERGFGHLDVVGIVHSAMPWSLEWLRADQPSLYVLEVNGGWCKRNRVSTGARARFA